MKVFSQIILILSGILWSFQCYAWSNYFRFVNNFNVAMTLTISPTFANVKNLCGGDTQHIDVGAHSLSCAFEFTTAQANERDVLKNSGTITFSRKDDPSSVCIYKYNYAYHPESDNYSDLHSENIFLQSCQGNLKPTEITLVNDHNQILPRPLIDTLMSTEHKEKAEKMTESIAYADCGGKDSDNCLIVSPDLNATYLKNGSTLAQALLLQLELDRYEPLNFAQFIGSHNAAISRHYTKSVKLYNLSHSDPDHYLTLTDQLKSGVRQLELDVQWHKDAVTICHDDIDRDPQGILCEDNYPLSVALAEIKSWVEKNPHTFLFIYFDVHAPLLGHVDDIDKDLESLEPYIFTPAMAMKYYHVKNNALPASQLSQDDLIQKYQKNIIVTNDDDTDNLKNSRYIFVNVENSPAAPLPEFSLDTFLSSKASHCDDANKYDSMRELFIKDDPEHYNLLRLNEGRTVVNYVLSVDDRRPEQYVNYFTTQNLPSMLHCPINIFSTSMLGYTCNAHSCDVLSTDPKLYSFLWSWNLGYPLTHGGSNIAYINPNTAHFENDVLSSDHSYSVLCYRKTSSQKTPALLQWYLENLKMSNMNKIYDSAEAACQNSGGVFAVPTTSYWMSDVMNVIHANKMHAQYVIVNYQYINNEWVPNAVRVEKNGEQILKGHSLPN